jgi:hypothetical protein
MKHYWISGLLCFSIGVGLSLHAEAADYFVEKGGNDANPGSRMQPFRTIQKAAGLMLPGDVCTISRGVYRETVRPAVSGKPDKWIRFQAAPGETVTIAGADEVVAWQQVTGALYRASASNVVQVLVDEVQATDNLDINDLAPALPVRASYWYDPLSFTVYLRLPHHDAPEGHRTEIQTRDWGLDFHNLAYIEVQGLNLRSCGMNWMGARFCRMEDGHIWWGGGQADVTNILGGVTNVASIHAAVVMGGRENELSNSSVIGSDGYGVVLLPDGVNNRLLNTLVRGREVPLERAFGILAQGTAPLIRNVSVLNFSGGALLCSNVFNARIENNDFYRCGAGQTNVSLVQLTGDGKGTILAYNWVHDNGSVAGDGVRFSGPVENYVFRQNVVWGQPGVALRLAGKVRFNYLLNNTCAVSGGGIDSEPGRSDVDFGETRVMNNILTGPSWTVTGGKAPAKLIWAKNYTGPAPGFVDETNRNFQLAAGSPCIDAGQEEPEFTDEYSGNLPDMGAYEQGKPYPVPGCRVNDNANKVVAPVVKVVLETETPGAELRYTLDGRTPDPSSERYTGAVSVVYGALVKARAFRQGMEESAVTTVQVRRVE